MLVVFLMHASGFFVPFDWHLKNAETSEALMPILLWLDLWLIPTFFLISGFSAWFSLTSRRPGKFLLERGLRLLIPFYTVGAFLLLPVQYYIEQVSHGKPVHDIWRIVPPYWDTYGAFRFRLDEPFLTNIWPGHLWFLEFLFLVSVILLPLLLLFKTNRGKRMIEPFASLCRRGYGLLLVLIPLILLRIGLRSTFYREHGWADVANYAVFFLAGYLLAGDPRFTQGYRRLTWFFLGLGVVASLAEFLLIFQFGYPYPGVEQFSSMYILFQVVMGIANLSWVLFFLGLGTRYLNFRTRALEYANEGLLPFYILHQTVLLVVGWYVIPLDLGILPKYLIISSSSFVLILGIYELLIRRFNPIRWIFGMRLRKKSEAKKVIEVAGVESA
jgi:glucan biosynthesis protein C